MGFTIPVENWLRGELREWADSLLDTERIRNDGYLDAATVRSWWHAYLQGDNQWHSPLGPCLCSRVAGPVAEVNERNERPAGRHIIHTIGQLERGGAEKQLSLLALALHTRGWDQVVVSFSRSGPWKNVLESGGIPVVEIPPAQSSPIAGGKPTR